jgi:hypothetical protein
LSRHADASRRAPSGRQILRQIRCGGEYRGGACDRWLASVCKDGYLYIACPRCRGYHKEPLSALLEDEREYLDWLEERRLKLEDSNQDVSRLSTKAFG